MGLKSYANADIHITDTLILTKVCSQSVASIALVIASRRDEMGYYTTFELTVIPCAAEEEALDKVAEVVGYEPFSQGTKWYDHDKNMTEVSRQIPGVLLILDGSGEESGDIWRKVWLNGEMVHSWRPDVEPPPVPDEILQRVGDYDGADFLRQKALSKLTPEDRKLLGLDES